MLEIIIATHGTLAEGFKNAVEVNAGQADHIHPISLKAAEDVEKFGEVLANQIHNLMNPEGVIVFTDLVSASPYNQSIITVRNLPNDANVFVIGGVNLPMVLEGLNHQFLGTKANEAIVSICDQGSTEKVIWKPSSIEEEDDF